MDTTALATRHDPLLRAVLLCGVVAPMLYAATVVWGATLFPGYSHVADPISALTQAGRDGTQGLQSLFVIYNALVMAYALAGISVSQDRPFRLWSFVLLIATALAGFLMWPFPQDAIGSPVTATGTVHIGLAAVESLGSLAAIAMAALDWRQRGATTLFRFSAACFMVVLLTGPLAGLGAAYGWPVMGLFERITIGAFEVWLLVTAGVQYLKAI